MFLMILFSCVLVAITVTLHAFGTVNAAYVFVIDILALSRYH